MTLTAAVTPTLSAASAITATAQTPGAGTPAPEQAGHATQAEATPTVTATETVTATAEPAATAKPDELPPTGADATGDLRSLIVALAVTLALLSGAVATRTRPSS